MRNSLVAAETEKYQGAWALDAYAEHSPGAHVLPLFLEMAQPHAGATVLDAGTGSGKGAVALRAAGFSVTACDLTADGLIDDARDVPFQSAVLWDDLTELYPQGVDYVYCCDVLEHIPTPFTMLVIRRLLDVARVGVFLSISTVPDQFGVWVGQPLHATVQPFTAWRDQLSALGTVVEARDLLTSGVFYVVPR